MKNNFKLSPLAIYLTSGFLIILFVLNYIMGTYYYSHASNFPYNISENYIKYTYNEDTPIAYKDLFKPTQSKIKIIASTNNEKIIGLFDPSLSYYHHSTKISMPSFFRYFSMDDYISGKKTAIYLADPILYTPEDCINLAKKYKVNKVINVLENSPLKYQETRLIQNLFSLTCEKGNDLYLVGNTNELSPYISSLNESGFVKQELSPIHVSIIDSIKMSIHSNFASYMLIAGFMIMILTIILFQGEIATKKSKIAYSIACGGTKNKILKQILSTFIIQTACLGMLGFGFRFFCILISSECFITYMQLLIIYVAYLLVVILLYAIIFYLNYQKIHKEVYA